MAWVPSLGLPGEDTTRAAGWRMCAALSRLTDLEEGVEGVTQVLNLGSGTNPHVTPVVP